MNLKQEENMQKLIHLLEVLLNDENIYLVNFMYLRTERLVANI